MATRVCPPVDEVLRDHRGSEVAVVRDGARTVIGVDPAGSIVASGADALAALEALPPGWWAGYLSYDLGRSIERVEPRTRNDLGLPDLHLTRFGTRLEVGPPARAVETGSTLGPWSSSLDRDGWIDRVRTIARHLRDGDCYQVNLTRRLETDAHTDPASLYLRLAAHNPAPHAALIRSTDVAVVSASPELFLRRDGHDVVSRPIKGTAVDAATLGRSDKDHAENVMIVDLVRNDLGRVCEYGSIEVPRLFEIEEHPGLHHLVSTVRGTLRPGVTPADIVRATFPPASVTGCPKPRVLQIIEDLEPVRRGVYCGAVGFIDTERDVMDLNVAIRTFTIAGGRTTFGVGGGIVADSDPIAEWEETELKARRLLAIASG